MCQSHKQLPHFLWTIFLNYWDKNPYPSCEYTEVFSSALLLLDSQASAAEEFSCNTERTLLELALQLWVKLQRA